MKKSNNKVTRFAIIVLALTMVALILVSGTYAKYTSEKTATSTARVAKWDIDVNGESLTAATPTTLTIDLWGTVLDTFDGNAEEDVDDTTKIIAPGTKGQFTITVTNNSEVTAECTVALALTNNDNIPLEFSTDGNNWTSNIASLGVGTSTPVELPMGSTDNSTELTVYWRWPFVGATGSAQTNATDTALGVVGTATATVTATITANQVD